MSTKKIWTAAEQRAIENNPDLPEDVAAAFAEDLNDVADEIGDIGDDLSPAVPGSVGERFPHLRNPRFV